MLQGVESISLVIACTTPDTAAEIAEEIGPVAAGESNVVRVPLLLQGIPNALAISALARFAAKRSVGMIDGLVANLDGQNT